MENKREIITDFEEAQKRGCITNYFEHITNVAATLTHITKKNEDRGFMIIAIDSKQDNEDLGVGICIAGATPENMIRMFENALHSNIAIRAAMMAAMAKYMFTNSNREE